MQLILLLHQAIFWQKLDVKESVVLRWNFQHEAWYHVSTKIIPRVDKRTACLNLLIYTSV